MVWQVATVVDKRMELVAAVLQGAAIAEVSRRLGVSRETAYKWLERYQREGEAGAQGPQQSAPELTAPDICGGGRGSVLAPSRESGLGRTQAPSPPQG